MQRRNPMPFDWGDTRNYLGETLDVAAKFLAIQGESEANRLRFGIEKDRLDTEKNMLNIMGRKYSMDNIHNQFGDKWTVWQNMKTNPALFDDKGRPDYLKVQQHLAQFYKRDNLTPEDYAALANDTVSKYLVAEDELNRYRNDVVSRGLKGLVDASQYARDNVPDGQRREYFKSIISKSRNVSPNSILQDIGYSEESIETIPSFVKSILVKDLNDVFDIGVLNADGKLTQTDIERFKWTENYSTFQEMLK